MHGNAFLIDRDVSREHGTDFVANARTLAVDILDGRQVLPSGANGGANRLIIFTGTASVEQSGSRDEIDRGVVRVRLRFPVSDPTDLSGPIQFRGSASVAALATVAGNEANITVGADAAEIVTDPAAPDLDGNQLPDKGLPKNELYLIIDAAVASEDGRIVRIAYQANVLIEDRNPELDSLLVRRFPTDQFEPSTNVEIGHEWEFQITLTGPVVDPDGFTVQLQSDQGEVPIALGPSGERLTQKSFTLQKDQTSAIFRAPTAGDVPGVIATITAVANTVNKSATIRLFNIR